MKLVTFQLPGDGLESARRVIATEIFRKIDSLDAADRLLKPTFGDGAEAITYTTLSREEFDALPPSIPMLP